MKSARIIALAAPAVFVAALGVAGTGLRALPEKPDVNALVGTLCAYVAMGPPGKVSVPFVLPASAETAETADTSLVIAPPAPVAETPVAETPAPPPEPDPIDYARLNQDVIVVADTLERFNQKLLRIIAQARAEQLRAEAQAASTAQPPSAADIPGAEMP